MSFKASVFSLAVVSALALTTAVFAEPVTGSGDTKEVRFEVSKGERKVELRAKGETYSFKMPELKDGEQRLISTDDGKVVDVTRKGSEYLMKAGNEEFTAVLFDGAGAGTRFQRIALPGMRDSLVISGADLTDAERQKVKEAIKGAGIDKPVKFMQESGAGHVFALSNLGDIHCDGLPQTEDIKGASWSSSGTEPKVIVSSDVVVKSGEGGQNVMVFRSGDHGSKAEMMEKVEKIVREKTGKGLSELKDLKDLKELKSLEGLKDIGAHLRIVCEQRKAEAKAKTQND